jgi:hypothetical protein
MGFLTPINLLWLGGSLALLVLIYLRARARMTVDVSSLMLFEELGAPVVQRRMLHLDALFWLEAAALSALSLALAGLYLRVIEPITTHRTHALIFDLGAAMGAREGGGSRLDAARGQALAIVAHAPAGTRFSVIGYDLGAHGSHAAGSDRRVTRAAIEELVPAAVAPRAAALKAALIRAREAAQIDLFTDHAPPTALVADVIDPARLNIHLLGAPAENLAVVSLDPGTPGIRPGHCVIRSFAQHPMRSTLTIESDRGERLNFPMIVEPESEAVVPFGPLTRGGLVHAHLATNGDALAADDDRWAYVAPGDAKSRALVLSPDPSVRDDLSRILLGINQNLTVEALDPAQYQKSNDKKSYELVVMHDTYVSGLNAPTILLIYPPPSGAGAVRVGRTLDAIELEDQRESDLADEALMLGRAREVSLPAGSEVIAHSAGSPAQGQIALAAIANDGEQHLGVIAFDVRHHLLMNPDDLEALLLTVQLVRRLTSPEHLRVVNTASYVTFQVPGGATMVEPDGVERKLPADSSGQVGFMAMSAGRYRLSMPAGESSIYANYFDEDESDLTARPQAEAPAQPATVIAHRSEPTAAGVMTLAMWLTALAMLMLLAESILLSRDWWSRWMARRV